ncbi:hypothetical protein VNO77_24105 [Canavalia gladiata]|uniref:Phytocyanin domain-containing protein n=1 Tax=Canavalia gladiata TaxID=3824 RepID=A0AAN9L8Z1_CANGL
MALCLPNASQFLVIICLLIYCSHAKEYVVGGSENSWKVPLPSPDSLNHWANTHRFRIGDVLIFKYDKRTESVHVVNDTDYSHCNTKGLQHVVFNDGNTKVSLTRSGPKHFISGTQAHCMMGLKLSVFVMPNKTKKKPHSPPPSPSPLPSPSQSSSFSLSSSPSPSPVSPNNGGVACGSSGGFIGIMMWVGVSLVMMCLI